MTTAKEILKYDVRIIQRLIKTGFYTTKDYEKFLKSISDVKEESAVAEVEEPPRCFDESSAEASDKAEGSKPLDEEE